MIIVLILMVSMLLGIFIGNSYKLQNNNTNNVDTIISNSIFDSINKDIYFRDSIINNLNNRLEYDIFKILHSSDSDAIKKFYELTSDGYNESLYGGFINSRY